MESTRMMKTAALPASVLVLAVAWVALATGPEMAIFGIGRYVGGLGEPARIAYRIVHFLDTWWGYAAAVAVAAALGLAWTVVFIKGMLQKLGVSAAIQEATML